MQLRCSKKQNPKDATNVETYTIDTNMEPTSIPNPLQLNPTIYVGNGIPKVDKKRPLVVQGPKGGPRGGPAV